jgi:hypothetical protein
MSIADIKAADARRDKARRAQHRLEKARKEARKNLGCESCGASKEDIRTEQSRLRAEMYARKAAA